MQVRCMPGTHGSLVPGCVDVPVRSRGQSFAGRTVPVRLSGLAGHDAFRSQAVRLGLQADGVLDATPHWCDLGWAPCMHWSRVGASRLGSGVVDPCPCRRREPHRLHDLSLHASPAAPCRPASAGGDYLRGVPPAPIISTGACGAWRQGGVSGDWGEEDGGQASAAPTQRCAGQASVDEARPACRGARAPVQDASHYLLPGWPQGARHVRCARCRHTTDVPRAGPSGGQAGEGRAMAQLTCGGRACRAQLTYPRGYNWVRCALCGTINNATQVTERAGRAGGRGRSCEVAGEAVRAVASRGVDRMQEPEGRCCSFTELGPHSWAAPRAHTRATPPPACPAPCLPASIIASLARLPCRRPTASAM